MNREDTPVTLATLESMPVMHRNGHKVVAATFWLALIGTYLGYTLSIDVSPIETLQNLVAFLQPVAKAVKV